MLDQKYFMQNHIEKEAKVFDINVLDVVSRLKQHGARKSLDTVTFIETYDFPAVRLKKRVNEHLPQKFTHIFREVEKLGQKNQSLTAKGAYLRLRKEGPRSELILKYSAGKKNARIKSEREISVPIRDRKEWKAAQTLLIQFGLKKVFHQEKRRVSYIHDKSRLRFDIDTWPGVPTYVEIEGESKKDIERGALMIGYSPSQLTSAKGAEIFKRYSVSPVYLVFKKGTVQVKHANLLRVMYSVLRNHDITGKNADVIVNHYYEAELKGRKTHGIRKFCWDLQFYSQRKGAPKIISNKGAVALVNGNKEIGPLAAQFCVELASQKARQFGISLIGITNFQRYGILSTWTKFLAEKGLVGIVCNTTEPFVLPPGTGKLPVLGTNPLSIGFPTSTDPIILDMSTTKEPMSLVWSERARGGELPAQSFFDAHGSYTTDPGLAKWAEAWGGIKGFNLSLMLQLLCGPLLGVDTTHTWKNPYEVGAIFIAINPKSISRQVTSKNVDYFSKFMRKNGVILPGDRSKKEYALKKKKKNVILSEQVWGWLNLI